MGQKIIEDKTIGAEINPWREIREDNNRKNIYNKKIYEDYYAKILDRVEEESWKIIQ